MCHGQTHHRSLDPEKNIYTIVHPNPNGSPPHTIDELFPKFIHRQLLALLAASEEVEPTATQALLCIVCGEYNASHRLPCGHRLLCFHCLQRLPTNTCPECRKHFDPWPFLTDMQNVLADHVNEEAYISPMQEWQPTSLRGLHTAVRKHTEKLLSTTQLLEIQKEYVSTEDRMVQRALRLAYVRTISDRDITYPHDAQMQTAVSAPDKSLVEKVDVHKIADSIVNLLVSTQRRAPKAFFHHQPILLEEACNHIMEQEPDLKYFEDYCSGLRKANASEDTKRQYEIIKTAMKKEVRTFVEQTITWYGRHHLELNGEQTITSTNRVAVLELARERSRWLSSLVTSEDNTLCRFLLYEAFLLWKPEVDEKYEAEHAADEQLPQEEYAGGGDTTIDDDGDSTLYDRSLPDMFNNFHLSVHNELKFEESEVPTNPLFMVECVLGPNPKRRNANHRILLKQPVFLHRSVIDEVIRRQIAWEIWYSGSETFDSRIIPYATALERMRMLFNKEVRGFLFFANLVLRTAGNNCSDRDGWNQAITEAQTFMRTTLFLTSVDEAQQRRLDIFIPQVLLWTLYRENLNSFLFSGGRGVHCLGIAEKVTKNPVVKERMHNLLMALLVRPDGDPLTTVFQPPNDSSLRPKPKGRKRARIEQEGPHLEQREHQQVEERI